jgi:AcrR family transcriptional regulator
MQVIYERSFTCYYTQDAPTAQGANSLGNKPDLAFAPAIPSHIGGSALDASWSRFSPAARNVLAAGIALFSDAGYLATTIRDLTGACGLTPPSFYNHFESKEALLYEIVTSANAELDRRLDTLPVTASPAETLTELVRTLVTFNLTHPKETRISNREWVFLHEDLRHKVSTHRRRVRSMFEETLASGEAGRGLLDGISKPPAPELEPRLLAMSIVNLSITASEWYHPDGPLNIDEVAEAHCRLAVRMAAFGTAPPKPASKSTRATNAVARKANGTHSTNSKVVGRRSANSNAAKGVQRGDA